jgi:hypothetical protein
VATQYFTREAQSIFEENRLRDMEEGLRSRLGPYVVRGGEFQFAGPDRAMANVHLKGSASQMWPVVRLRKEKGEWKIEKILSP